MITAMILAGGNGTRVGAECPKQFIQVLGKPVLAYTIEIFQTHPKIDAIQVVCHEQWKEYLKQIIREYHDTKVKWITDGGDTFQKSVIHGIEDLKNKIKPDDYVLIQYGAAPFTSHKIIDDVISVMQENGSAVSVTPCYQLMGKNEKGHTSRTWVNRDDYIQIACPQGFQYSYIRDIYRRAEEQGLFEKVDPHTTSLMYALGDTLYQAYGDQTNIKITTREDIDLFEGYLLMKKRHAEEKSK